MKSYTDLSQSKKLAEILPLESADQTWERIAIAGANLDVPEELQYRHNGDMPFKHYSGIGVPCWSLAALLDVLPDYTLQTNTDGTVFVVCESAKPVISDAYDNPVDACVAMIERLHELNLL